MTESELLIAAQQGDREAFASIINGYWDRLYRWLLRLTRDTQTAEDLTQDAFLKAFANLKRFEPGTNFRAWLFRIAHNNFVNFRRANQVPKVALEPTIPPGQLSPEQAAIGAETIQLVMHAVAKLPSDFRAALLLRIEEQLSFREIASILETTEETARWRVFKARQKLMSTLHPDLLPSTQEKAD